MMLACPACAHRCPDEADELEIDRAIIRLGISARQLLASLEEAGLAITIADPLPRPRLRGDEERKAKATATAHAGPTPRGC